MYEKIEKFENDLRRYRAGEIGPILFYVLCKQLGMEDRDISHIVKAFRAENKSHARQN